MKTLLVAALLAGGCGDYFTTCESDPPVTTAQAALTSIPAPAGATPYKVWIAGDIPAGPVMAGMSVWEKAGISVATESDPSLAEVRVLPLNGLDCQYGQTTGQEIRISTRLLDAVGILYVAAHEFGHRLGLSHIPGHATALMNAYGDVSAPPVITDADLDQARAVWGIQ